MVRKDFHRRLERLEAEVRRRRDLAAAVDDYQELAERESPTDVPDALMRIAASATADLRDALLQRARELRTQTSSEVH